MLHEALRKSRCKAFFATKSIGLQLFNTTITPTGCNFKISEILTRGLKAENFVRFHGHGNYPT